MDPSDSGKPRRCDAFSFNKKKKICDNAVIIDVAVALFFRHKAFFKNIFLAFWMEPTRKFLFKWSPVV